VITGGIVYDISKEAPCHTRSSLPTHPEFLMAQKIAIFDIITNKKIHSFGTLPCYITLHSL
jgi:hypothetical protein